MIKFDKTIMLRFWELAAGLLNLPSKNYVPENVRRKNMDKSNRDSDDNDLPEYDEEIVKNFIKGIQTAANSRDRRRVKLASNNTGSVIDAGNGLYSTEPQPEPQEEEMQTKQTTAEKQNQPETQREEEVSDDREKAEVENAKAEKGDEITHAEGDPLNYSHVDNKKLEEDYGVKIRNLDIDERVIFSVEKGQDYLSIATEGYIPIKNRKTGEIFSSSGVTIGFGFDIGQRNEYELRRIFGDGPLFEKLLPYAKQKGENAVKALKEKPLVLTEGEALAVTRAVYANINETVRGHFDKEKGKGAYDKLDRDYKTAMLSHYMFRGQNSMLSSSKKDSKKENESKTDVWHTVINNTGDIEALAKTIYYKDGSKGRGKKIAKHFQGKYDEDESWSEWLK